MKKMIKPFDAVEMMLKIREQLNEQFKDMKFQEQKAYIRNHVKLPVQKNLQNGQGEYK